MLCGRHRLCASKADDEINASSQEPMTLRVPFLGQSPEALWSWRTRSRWSGDLVTRMSADPNRMDNSCLIVVLLNAFTLEYSKHHSAKVCIFDLAVEHLSFVEHLRFILPTCLL